MPHNTALTPATARHHFALALLLVALVPVALALAYLALGLPFDGRALALGAAGWLAALVARGPFAALLVKLKGSPEAAQPWIVGLSGPTEEGVRFALVRLLIASPAAAAWLGLGWAAIEVLYAIVNAVVVRQLQTRTDEEAVKAREALAAMGLGQPNMEYWGIVERLSASLLHIGFTLILAGAPMAVLVTMPLHSALNLGLLRLLKRGMALAQGALLLVSVALTAVGVWLVM